MASEIVQQQCSTTCDPMESMHAGSLFESVIRFTDWADSQRNLSAQRAMDRFGMQRATAYRWVNAYRAARGIHA